MAHEVAFTIDKMKCVYWYKEIMYHIYTLLCLIKVNSTIELIVHTSCFCVLDLLFVTVSNRGILFSLTVALDSSATRTHWSFKLFFQNFKFTLLLNFLSLIDCNPPRQNLIKDLTITFLTNCLKLIYYALYPVILVYSYTLNMFNISL